MQVSRASFDVVVLLVEDSVAHFVILPNYEEDETVLRETPENLGCSPSAERHMRKVSLENLFPLSFSSPNTQDQVERLIAETGHHLEDTPNTQWAFPTALEEIWRGTSLG